MPTSSTIEKDQAVVTRETISTSSGVGLQVEKHLGPQQLEIMLTAQMTGPCIFHWGIRSKGQAGWRSLPQSVWPEGTSAAGPNAMQTPFIQNNGEPHIAIRLDPHQAPESIEFALFFPAEKRWDNNARRNYRINLSGGNLASTSLEEALKNRLGSGENHFKRTFDVPELGSLAIGVAEAENRYEVFGVSDIPGPLVLHWGIAKGSPHEWLEPPQSWPQPSATRRAGNSAETPFESLDGLRQFELSVPKGDAPLGVQFVLKQGIEGRWLKYQGGNFYVPIRAPSQIAAGFDAGVLGDMAKRITQSETGSGSWTLMHRFNLCFDLLDQARGNNEALALLYVWLRFSAIRQLTWQRNYNTKPRELAHAQDRLGGRLSDLYRNERRGRPIIRLILATIGRGGDGQSIRDEILQIMHRHHVKEVTGHFLEEWHQKLHNNTTPDDISICEAYLEFLRSNGNSERFYQTLQNGGVTRERLVGFERPIRTQPDFVGHLKEGLIHDFEHFLKTLKAVHSGTDLETAIQAARNGVDGGTQDLMWEIWNRRNAPVEGTVPLVGTITEGRRRLAHLLNDGQQHRELLYLDLALEQLVRTVVERNLHQRLQGEQLAELIGRVLENVILTQDSVELGARHWNRLMQVPGENRFKSDWSLHAKSVVDRIGRALGTWTDSIYQLLQPKAQLLGQAFGAEPWTISLFSEEVVRGSSLGFALSMLLQQFRRILRESASLGTWEIVSRGQGTGKVEVVEQLREAQAREFGGPTVVIADKVAGDEELPVDVVAVIAPDVTDLMSHVAVRARNSQVLFASCSDPDLFEQLKGRRGQLLSLEVTPAGDVTFTEVTQVGPTKTPGLDTRSRRMIQPPPLSAFAVTTDQFNKQIVGSKSFSQALLKSKLPAWVKQPASLALPFGAFEKVLALDENKEASHEYQRRLNELGQICNADTLVALRQAVGTLAAPDRLKQELREAFDKSGMTWPPDWDSAWRSIKQVWASKWNERAVLSRNKLGLKHEDLFMAVLIQPVVPADYAFVLHTANPSTSNPGELYGELVLGLGETLVGNFPGRALGFIWQKKPERIQLVSYPSKSIGLYGGGLIFRSDSNGEDLADFAGAGLYDSVLLNPPREVQLDYSNEAIVWDVPLREGTLAAIGRLGVALEKALGSPQDIEGAIVKGEYYIVQTRPQVGLS